MIDRDAQTTADRGQVGIETLIIFIAMILVAAVAAGVLINTAGFLQNKASSTSQDSQDQVSNQVIVISATGSVNTTSPYGGSALETNNVNETELTVMKSPGADEIDLAAATIEWIGPKGTDTLTYYDAPAHAEDANFSVSAIKDDGGSEPVLTSKEDRFTVTLNHTGNGSEVLRPLHAGEEATLRLVTQSGSQYVYILNVPESLSAKDNGEAVEM